MLGAMNPRRNNFTHASTQVLEVYLGLSLQRSPILLPAGSETVNLDLLAAATNFENRRGCQLGVADVVDLIRLDRVSCAGRLRSVVDLVRLDRVSCTTSLRMSLGGVRESYSLESSPCCSKCIFTNSRTTSRSHSEVVVVVVVNAGMACGLVVVVVVVSSPGGSRQYIRHRQCIR